jgi:chorismate mutase/prephenate dehydratase
LLALRQRLDAIDEAIVRGIADRFTTVAQIIEEKQGRSAGIRDAEREREVLSRVERKAEALGVSGPLARKVFAEIIAHSVTRQVSTLSGVEAAGPKLNVAYQGSPYTFNHLAAEKLVSGLGRDAELAGKASFRQVVSAVLSGEADLALLLLENTAAGSISKVYDLLLTHDDLHIVREETYKVDLCLGGVEEVPLGSIERVLSHPLALEQCSHFLDELPRARAVPAFDTAEALWSVAQARDPSQAAIGSPEGIEAHGLHVLRRGIGNQEEIWNRYVALSRAPVLVDERIACKTSIIFATKHEAGALMRCLEAFSSRRLSLTKLESRPRPHRAWEYLFFMDFEGNLGTAVVAEAVEELRRHSTFIKILGSYPAKATAGVAGAGRATLAR